MIEGIYVPAAYWLLTAEAMLNPLHVWVVTWFPWQIQTLESDLWRRLVNYSDDTKEVIYPFSSPPIFYRPIILFWLGHTLRLHCLHLSLSDESHLCSANYRLTAKITQCHACKDRTGLMGSCGWRLSSLLKAGKGVHRDISLHNNCFQKECTECALTFQWRCSTNIKDNTSQITELEAVVS